MLVFNLSIHTLYTLTLLLEAKRTPPYMAHFLNLAVSPQLVYWTYIQVLLGSPCVALCA